MRLLDYATKNGMTTFGVLEKCVMGSLKVANIYSLVKQYVKIMNKIKDIRIVVKDDGDALIDIFAEDIRENSDFRNILTEAVAEAKYVVVMSAIDELIPRLDKDSEISLDKQLEEQRQLFYVAITRCKSSDSGYPGTLIISSFVGLPGNEALKINIPANPFNWRSVSATRFIRDFGETAPATISPRKK